MPKLAREYTYRSDIGYRPYPQTVSPIKQRPKTKQQTPKRVLRKKKTNPLRGLISLVMLALIGFYVIPYGFDRVSRPLIFGDPYKDIKVDNTQLMSPTINYLSNALFLNTRLLAGAKVKKPEMTTLYTTQKMPVIEAKLTKLMAQYPSVKPSIFVWDYDSGKYIDIKADESFPTASIIKIPILIDLFKSIEANQLTIYDEMTLTDYYQSEGSGDLQYRPVGSKYTLDQLARVMIEKSDNTATNMIMSAVGSMTDVNSAVRSWGLKHTYVNNWLPDIAGTNHSTAKDLATMLYNLDNPGFLNINSREYIIDYMSHVENNRLIQAGLDPKALFVHKTGDIGKMLGDAGIVFTPTGKKYICVILATRPYNSPQGKDFIVNASKIIYNSVISGNY